MSTVSRFQGSLAAFVGLSLVVVLSTCSALPVAAEQVTIQYRRWHGVSPEWFLSNGSLTVSFAELECRHAGYVAYQIAGESNAGTLDFSQFSDAGRWHRIVLNRCQNIEQELKRAIVPVPDPVPPLPPFLRPYITEYCSTIISGGALP